MKLTDTVVRNIKPAGVQQEIPDSAYPGLYLRVMPTGSKSWAVRYRADGFHRRMTLGRYPKVSLADARKRAGDIADQVERGNDPQADRHARHAVLPRGIKEAVAVYIESYAKVRTVRWKETARLFDLHVFPYWGNRSIDSIRRRDVVALLERVRTKAPVRANRLLAALRHFFNWCVNRDALDLSPASGVKPLAVETVRERVLSDDELAVLLVALDRLETRFADAFKLLLYTGARRTEVFEMRWAEVDLATATWIVPAERTKKRHYDHLVPLSQPAVSVLRRLEDEGGSSALVFPAMVNRDADSDAPESAMSGISKAKKALDVKIAEVLAEIAEDAEQRGGTPCIAAFPAWRLHDLRRTCATNLQKLGVRLEVTEAVLHHLSGSRAGVVGIYQRYDWADEKREALMLWAKRLQALRP